MNTLNVPLIREAAQRTLARAEEKVNTGHYATGKKLYRQVVALCDGLCPDLVGTAYFNQGNIALDESEYDEALALYGLALGSFGIRNDWKVRAAQTTFQLGRVFHAQGYLESAELAAIPAVRKLEEQKEERSVAIGYNLLAMMEWQRDHPRKALAYVNKSLEIKEKFGMERGIAASLVLRSLVTSNTQFFSRYQNDRVFHDINRAIEIYKAANDWLGLGHLFYASGRIHEVWLGRDEAETEYRRTLDVASSQQHPFPKGKAVALQGLARRHGNRKYHREAVKIFKKLGCNPEHIPKTPTSLDKILETFI